MPFESWDTWDHIPQPAGITKESAVPQRYAPAGGVMRNTVTCYHEIPREPDALYGPESVDRRRAAMRAQSRSERATGASLASLVADCGGRVGRLDGIDRPCQLKVPGDLV